MKTDVFDDHPKEECGLFGVYGIEDPGALIYRGLFAIQHRGQEGAGISVADGKTIQSFRGQGLLSEA
ncbi:MAG: amidophosphoribosyltransferase, partial [Candidatus Promineifilaceae bacterium]